MNPRTVTHRHAHTLPHISQTRQTTNAAHIPRRLSQHRLLVRQRLEAEPAVVRAHAARAHAAEGQVRVEDVKRGLVHTHTARRRALNDPHLRARAGAEDVECPAHARARATVMRPVRQSFPPDSQRARRTMASRARSQTAPARRQRARESTPRRRTSAAIGGVAPVVPLHPCCQRI